MCLINIQPFLLNMLWLYGNYSVQGAFVIIFLICRDLLNYLRSLCSHYNMKIIIIKEICICACHFEES